MGGPLDGLPTGAGATLATPSPRVQARAVTHLLIPAESASDRATMWVAAVDSPTDPTTLEVVAANGARTTLYRLGRRGPAAATIRSSTPASRSSTSPCAAGSASSSARAGRSLRPRPPRRCPTACPVSRTGHSRSCWARASRGGRTAAARSGAPSRCCRRTRGRTSRCCAVTRSTSTPRRSGRWSRRRPTTRSGGASSRSTWPRGRRRPGSTTCSPTVRTCSRRTTTTTGTTRRTGPSRRRRR